MTLNTQFCFEMSALCADWKVSIPLYRCMTFGQLLSNKYCLNQHLYYRIENIMYHSNGTLYTTCIVTIYVRETAFQMTKTRDFKQQNIY